MAKVANKLIKLGVFSIIRHRDESHCSGTGRVCDGIIFEGGRTVICWRGEVTSITVYDNFNEFKKIHIDAHPKNRTEIIWHSLKEKC